MIGLAPRRCGQGKGTGYGTVQALLKVGKVEMAQKVELEDDLTGGPAEQTVRFAFEGSDYEIDLSAKNAAAFGKQLAPYIEHARKAGRAPARRPGRTAVNRQRSSDIRAWAKEHRSDCAECAHHRVYAGIHSVARSAAIADGSSRLRGYGRHQQPAGVAS